MPHLPPVPRPLTAVWNRIRTFSFSHVQAVVGTLAGIVSITGALFSVAQFVHPNKTGELVAVVQDAGSHRAVVDAAVEVLTTDNALVATLAPDAAGRAAQPLREGAYVVRVSHPRYAPEVRHIQVLPRQTVEVRAALRAGSSSPSARAASNGWRAVRRALHF
jgi:hypothetical protein